MTKLTFYSVKSLFLWFSLSLILVACGQEPSSEKVEKIDIPQLNNGNIHAFSVALSKEYFNTTSSLITAFNSHKQAGKHFEFTQFRNNTWTPAYIKEKRFYQSVYKKNKGFINSGNTKPLFLAYENLIYIGIGLKNSLLDQDIALEKEAMSSLEQDKATINTILNVKK